MFRPLKGSQHPKNRQNLICWSLETKQGNIPLLSVHYTDMTSLRPFFDRRKGRIISGPKDLLCDFVENFPCLWGPVAGRWAVVERGTNYKLLIRNNNFLTTTFYDQNLVKFIIIKLKSQNLILFLFWHIFLWI